MRSLSVIVAAVGAFPLVLARGGPLVTETISGDLAMPSSPAIPNTLAFPRGNVAFKKSTSASPLTSIATALPSGFLIKEDRHKFSMPTQHNGLPLTWSLPTSTLASTPVSVSNKSRVKSTIASISTTLATAVGDRKTGPSGLVSTKVPRGFMFPFGDQMANLSEQATAPLDSKPSLLVEKVIVFCVDGSGQSHGVQTLVTRVAEREATAAPAPEVENIGLSDEKDEDEITSQPHRLVKRKAGGGRGLSSNKDKLALIHPPSHGSHKSTPSINTLTTSQKSHKSTSSSLRTQKYFFGGASLLDGLFSTASRSSPRDYYLDDTCPPFPNAIVYFKLVQSNGTHLLNYPNQNYPTLMYVSTRWSITHQNRLRQALFSQGCLKGHCYSGPIPGLNNFTAMTVDVGHMCGFTKPRSVWHQGVSKGQYGYYILWSPPTQHVLDYVTSRIRSTYPVVEFGLLLGFTLVLPAIAISVLVFFGVFWVLGCVWRGIKAVGRSIWSGCRIVGGFCLSCICLGGRGHRHNEAVADVEAGNGRREDAGVELVETEPPKYNMQAPPPAYTAW